MRWLRCLTKILIAIIIAIILSIALTDYVILCFSSTLDHLIKVFVHCPKVRVQLSH